jgi:hypothetical protein
MSYENEDPTIAFTGDMEFGSAGLSSRLRHNGSALGRITMWEGIDPGDNAGTAQDLDECTNPTPTSIARSTQDYPHLSPLRNI